MGSALPSYQGRLPAYVSSNFSRPNSLGLKRRCRPCIVGARPGDVVERNAERIRRPAMEVAPPSTGQALLTRRGSDTESSEVGWCDAADRERIQGPPGAMHGGKAGCGGSSPQSSQGGGEHPNTRRCSVTRRRGCPNWNHSAIGAFTAADWLGHLRILSRGGSRDHPLVEPERQGQSRLRPSSR